MVFKIGITGGIASGKSHCLKYLSALDNPRIYTLNLDFFAAKIYNIHPFALRNVEAIFCSATVLKSRFNEAIGVNRVKLGEKVFKNDH